LFDPAVLELSATHGFHSKKASKAIPQPPERSICMTPLPKLLKSRKLPEIILWHQNDTKLKG
ncbi:TPA: hypothetical protein ACWZJK_004951, partial [Escherichia coli]